MSQDDMGRDDLDIGYDDLGPPPSRFGMMTGTLVGIGAITLAIFTGVIWYAYNTGSERAESGLPVAQAEQGETKVKPADPGGATFAHQDKTVYDKIDGNEGSVEQLLPGSEEPQEKPRIITPYNNEMPADGQPKVLRLPPSGGGEALSIPSEAPQVTAPEIADPMGREPGTGDRVAAEPVPEVTTEAPAMAALPDEKETPAPTVPSQDQAALDAVATQALKEAPSEPATASPVTGDGSYVLQLGAFRTEAAADAGWKLLMTRHTQILGGMEHFIVPADLGERGRFFRLQAGPFVERTAANEQCTALKTAGVDCLVATR